MPRRRAGGPPLAGDFIRLSALWADGGLLFLFCPGKREKVTKREYRILGSGGSLGLELRNSGRLPRRVSVRLGGTIAARAVVELAWHHFRLAAYAGGCPGLEALFGAALCGCLLWGTCRGMRSSWVVRRTGQKGFSKYLCPLGKFILKRFRICGIGVLLNVRDHLY